MPQAETGQGIWTALPQIVADELGAAWETVAVEPAPLTDAYANPLAPSEGWLDGSAGCARIECGERITAGSTSVRAFEQPLREAAAVARAMLVGAAADRWNVEPGECDTADGFVINGGADLHLRRACRGSRRPQPAVATRRSATVDQGPADRASRCSGSTDRPRRDGSWRFAGDVRLPGHAVRHRFGSRRRAGALRAFRAMRSRHAPGVRHVAARDDWIAVVADSWWAAERALKAANPMFSGRRSPTRHARRCSSTRSPTATRESGSAAAIMMSAVAGSRPLAATYYVAPSQHLGLEPLTATARSTATGSKSGRRPRRRACARSGGRAAGSAHRTSRFIRCRSGEPAGRALEADAIPIAVELARELEAAGAGHPVAKREPEPRPRVAPGALARMTALPGAGGITAAWKMRVATADGLGSALARALGRRRRRASSARTRARRRGAALCDSQRARSTAMHAELPFAAGYMRGSPQREFAFFTESFIDELARAAGHGAARLPHVDARRQRRGSRAACRRRRGSRSGTAAGPAARWGSPAARPSDRTSAWSRARASATTRGSRSTGWSPRSIAGASSIRGLVAQQIEGGLIWALGQATVAAPEWVAGMPRARPIGGIGLPRLGDAPEIVVEIIPSSDAPGRRQRPRHAAARARRRQCDLRRHRASACARLPFDPMAAA